MKIYAFDAQGTTEVSGSLFISGSVTADNFNISDQAVGTPALYSSTNLNLSASNAVVVTSSPLRVASLTNTQTGSFTGQDGDIIFNSTRAAYMVYSGSAWRDVIVEGFTASYASQALSSSYSSLSSQSVNNNTSSGSLSFWQGSQAEYNLISGSASNNTIYFVV